MRQQNRIWTTISLDLYDKIETFRREQNFSTVTKVLLYVLKNHDGLKEDYKYNSARAKTLMVTVDPKTYEEIVQKANENSMSISRYVRSVLFSFFNL